MENTAKPATAITPIEDNENYLQIIVTDNTTGFKTNPISIRKNVNTSITKPEICNPGIFVVAGNIGAGKSTLEEIIKPTNLFTECIPEPVNKFTYLDDFYKDPTRYSYTLQHQVFIERMKSIINLKSASVLIERWVHDDIQIFAQNCVNNGTMTEKEFNLHKDMYQTFLPFIPKTNGVIYLRVSPETAHQRMKKRSRDSEKEVSLDYLKQIHTLHENLYNPNNLTPEHSTVTKVAGVPVLIINFEKDIDNDQFKLLCLNNIQIFKDTAN